MVYKEFDLEAALNGAHVAIRSKSTKDTREELIFERLLKNSSTTVLVFKSVLEKSECYLYTNTKGVAVICYQDNPELYLVMVPDKLVLPEQVDVIVLNTLLQHHERNSAIRYLHLTTGCGAIKAIDYINAYMEQHGLKSGV